MTHVINTNITGAIGLVELQLQYSERIHPEYFLRSMRENTQFWEQHGRVLTQLHSVLQQHSPNRLLLIQTAWVEKNAYQYLINLKAALTEISNLT